MAKLGVCRATVYNYLDQLRSDGVTATFLLSRGRGGPGISRLKGEVEHEVQAIVDSIYKTKQRLRPNEVWKEIETEFRKRGLKVSRATVYRRIAAIDQQEALRARQGADVVRKKHKPLYGHYDADHMMQVVMIDTTPLDLHLTDSVTRLVSVGRPYLTVAIDVWSRCVLAFAITFDPPSAATIGEVITMAVLDKRRWLADRGIVAEWPMYGLPVCIHADGGPEHDNRNLKRSAAQYGISIIFRPTQSPDAGGHIERLLGNFNSRIHAVPGAAFSNVIERAGYESEKMARLIREDVERWFVSLLVEYHNSKHSTLGLEPIAKWIQGLYGTDVTLPWGRPDQVTDADRFRRDFFPMRELTVQAYGLRWDGLHYNDPCLNYWRANGRGRKFIVRRDPWDVSYVWFLDPLSDTYLKVHLSRSNRTPMSAYELSQIRTWLKLKGLDNTEDNIFRAREERRRIEEAAKQTTLRARRRNERLHHHQQIRKARAKDEARSEANAPVNVGGNAAPGTGAVVIPFTPNDGKTMSNGASQPPDRTSIPDPAYAASTHGQSAEESAATRPSGAPNVDLSGAYEF